MEQPTDREALLAHARGVRALVRGLVADEATADDVMQQTWLAALVRRRRPGVPLGAWLRRVARNFALRRRRDESRRTRRERAAFTPEAPPNPAEAAARFELHRCIVDELNRLEEPYRSTLILRFFEGHAAAEIARHAGIPSATVRTRLKRGLEMIRRRLDREGGGMASWFGLLAPWLQAGPAKPAVATGAILMGAKIKIALASLVLLSLAGGLWIVAGERHRAPGVDRAADRRGGSIAEPLHLSSAPESSPEARPAPPESAHSLLVTGRVLDAERQRVVAGKGILIGRMGFSRSHEATTDGEGRFGASMASVEAKINDGVSLLSQSFWIRVEGYAVRTSVSGRVSEDATVDLGDLSLDRGVPVSGRVLSAHGEGVQGAVLLLSMEAPSSPPSFAPTQGVPVGRSGADGVFELGSPVPLTPQWPWKLMAVSDAGIGCVDITALSGTDRLAGVEIRIDPAAPLDVEVTDESGAALAGAILRAEPRFSLVMHAISERWGFGRHGHDLWTGSRDDVRAIFEVATGEDGRATFDRLPLPGPYDIVASSDGYQQGWQDDVGVERNRRGRATIRLLPFRVCAVVGRVRQRDATPVAGATVEAAGAVSTTDLGGGFRLELSPSYGDADLIVRAEGHPVVMQRVGLLRDRDVDDVEIVMEQGLPVSGRVVDQNHNAIPGAGIRLTRRDGTQVYPDQAITDTDGTFRIPNAAPGPWILSVWPPEDGSAWGIADHGVVQGGDVALEITVPRLGRGATRVVVRIVDVATGAALDPEGAYLVPLDSAEDSEYAKPSEPPARRAGEVVAEALYPGGWRLWVSADGYAPGHIDFTVRQAEAEIRLTLGLGPPASIRGHVSFDSPAAPAARERVAVSWSVAGPPCPFMGPGWESDYRPWHSAEIGSDGSFVMKHLMPGPCTFSIRGQWTLGSAKLDLRPGAEAEVEILARPAGQLRFRSVAPVPSNTSSATLWVAAGDAPWERTGETALEAGKPLLHSLLLLPGPVRWRLRFGAKPDHTVEGTAMITAGETTEIQVQPRGG